MKKSAKSIRTKVFSLCASCIIASYSSALLAESEQDHSGGFLKLGLGYKFDQNPFENEQKGLALFLNGRYQMENGLFIEAAFGANKRREGLNVGYNFYNTTDWSFDLTTVRAFGETKIIIQHNEVDSGSEPSVVTEERSESEMLGLRATHSWGNTNMQVILAPVLLNDDYDDGVYASAWLAHSWQIKNWEVHASVGLEYRSQEMIAHYFEPTEALQRVGFPDYKASSGVDYTSQLSASYPITQNILFESYVRYTKYADSITNSPIINITSQIPGRDDAKTEFGVLVSYVF